MIAAADDGSLAQLSHSGCFMHTTNASIGLLRTTALRSLLIPGLIFWSCAAWSAVIQVDPIVSPELDDGQCSLIEAIENANQNRDINADCNGGTGDDILQLAASFNYQFRMPYDSGNNALPVITDNLEIQGFNSIISRDTFSNESFRLLEFNGGTHSLRDLTLSGGRSVTPMTGGGALLASSSNLTIDTVAIIGNEARDIFAFGGALRLDDSTVEINHSRLQGNSTESTSPQTGGGAIAQFNGSLTVNRSALLNNAANDCSTSLRGANSVGTGGALRIEATSSAGAFAIFNDSTIADNKGRIGGGIHLVAVADTGAIGEDVLVQLVRSTLVLNDAEACPGAASGDGLFVQEASGGSGLVIYGSSILHGNGQLVQNMIVGTDCQSNFPSQTFMSFDGNVLDNQDNCTAQLDTFSDDFRNIVDPMRNGDHYLPLRDGPAVDFSEASFNCDLSLPDQVGNPRAGGPGMGGDICDAGAIELQYPVDDFTLQTSVLGNGSGSINSSPGGINCPNACTASYPVGTLVSLMATPASASTFNGWGGDCSGNGACQVSMDQMRDVTASFELEPVLLNVLIDAPGDAMGGVTSNPSGIDCPIDCQQIYPQGTIVTLTATPEAGSEFTGWGGVCAKTTSNICTVELTVSRGATARFAAVMNNPTLNVNVTGPGSITDSTGIIDCPGVCSASYPANTNITLTATPDNDASFQNFTGACSGQICNLQLTDDQQVGAIFLAADDLLIDGFE